MAIQMIGEQVLVAAAPKEERTEGGIILSADVKTTASEPGIVMATGPKVDEAITKGCTIYLDWSKGLPVRMSGQNAIIIHAENIKAVIS
jgi:co-chaperonin GroES (HSP10)|tara:strand:+ start:2161 stop:2427 length:267 start_codon:yes stop_codon:yes gene_type:complete